MPVVYACFLVTVWNSPKKNGKRLALLHYGFFTSLLVLFCVCRCCTKTLVVGGVLGACLLIRMEQREFQIVCCFANK